jgi:hypothetical protein
MNHFLKEDFMHTRTGSFVKFFRRCRLTTCLAILINCVAPISSAQQTEGVVPTLVNFSGTLTDVNGKPLSGVVGMTFYLYKDEQGGSPLWNEIQNVQPDKSGHYSVMLGSTASQGLPTDLFASGEARWLGVQAEGQAEQPRILLLSVPYALKAGDAQTLGGLPATAFALANSSKESAGSAAVASTSGSTKAAVPPANPAVTGKGVVDYIPMWDTTSDIIDSIIFQKSSEIGINTTTPAALLDVNGKSDIRDTLTLFPKSTDNTLAVNGTSFKIDSTGKVTFISGQTFPGTGTITGVTTATGSGLSGGGTTGTLSLKVPSAGITNAMLANSRITLNANTAGGLTTPGAMTLGSTYTIGLKPCSANQILEYSGTAWNCSSAGTGTITGVTAGTDLTGGGTSGAVTLNLDTTKVPLLASANTFTGSQAITLNNNTQALNVTQNGGGSAIVASTTTGFGSAVAATGAQYGVYAQSLSGFAVYASTTNGTAVVANSNAGAGNAIVGQALNNTTGANTVGVMGSSVAPLGVGTRGQWLTPSTVGNNTIEVGVWGDSSAGDGVHGTSDSSVGVYGASANFYGVGGVSNSPSAAGVIATNTNGGYGVLASTTAGGTAGYFGGNLQTTGTITTYNGVPTYGNGIPSIMFELSSSSGGGGLGTSTLFTPVNDGIYRITAFQECTGSSGGVSNFVLAFQWTVPALNSPNSLGYSYAVNGGSCGGSFPSYASGTVVAHVKGGTPVQYSYPGMDAPFQTLILVEQLL